MDQEHSQKLVLAVYRVTEFFPEKEPLRFQIRELANKILADLALANPHPDTIANKGELAKNIKTLFLYFNLAKAQNWVDPRNFEVLKSEYLKIQKLTEDDPIILELGRPAPVAKLASSNPGNPGRSFGPVDNLSRKDKIMEEINKSGMVKIGDLIKLFPGVNRRTVLRDVDKICQTGRVARKGSGRGVYYAKNGHNNENNVT